LQAVTYEQSSSALHGASWICRLCAPQCKLEIGGCLLLHAQLRAASCYPLALSRWPLPAALSSTVHHYISRYIHGLRYMHVHVSTLCGFVICWTYLMRSRYVKLITDTKSHKNRAWRGDRPIGHRLYVCSSSQQTLHTYIFPCNIRLYYVSTFSSCAISWCPYSNFDSGVYSMLNYVNCVITCFNFVLNSNIFYNHSFSGRWYDRW